MFVTFKRTNIRKIQPVQLDVNYFLENFNKLYKIEDPRVFSEFTRFHTIEVVDPEKRQDLKNYSEMDSFWSGLEQIASLAAPLVEDGAGCMVKYYERFYIPKHSGGFREISAPQGQLKIVQTLLKDFIQDKMNVLSHDCAYAYIKGRSTKQAVERHQENCSKWFLKIDISDFFPSCDGDLIYNSLLNLYPFTYLQERQNYEEVMKTLINACLLNGVLPQGSPASPLLSNLVMVSVDYHLNLYLRKNQFIYTRYADDILISSQYSFNWGELQDKVEALLSETSKGRWKVKKQKTRYGSASGRNWNLGLMLNKDNEITVGHKKKKLFKVMLNNFVNCYNACDNIPKEAIQQLQGLYSYYVNVEPTYFKDLVDTYSMKIENGKHILDIFTEYLSL